jgi:hypothetical protein
MQRSLCGAWADARAEFQQLLAASHRAERRDGARSHARREERDASRPADCECQRILEVEMGGLDGFALECHFLGRAMRLALATGRTMLVSPGWRSAYTPPEMCPAGNGTVAADGGPWGCVWGLANSCPYGARSDEATRAKCARRWRAQNPHAGIIKKASAHFNTAYYGPARSRRVYFGTFSFGDLHINGYDPKLALQQGGGAVGSRSMPPFDDPIPSWERRYGSFWVRAQIQDFLWQPVAALARRIDEHPTLQQLSQMERAGEVFIALHIRYTDNIPTQADDFGRDARVTRSLDHFMIHAARLRQTIDPQLRTVYLATDSTEVLNASRAPRWAEAGWSFLHNPLALRSTATELMWFRQARAHEAVNVFVDIEALRRADYLVGSFSSNVFRLGAELNVAHHVGIKYSPHVERIASVDVEWYADP